MKLQRTLSRVPIYVALVAFSAFYLLPFYVMIITGLKPYQDLNVTRMWELPRASTSRASSKDGDGWRRTFAIAP
jgi:ABC-type glycerol-3-phosphate transport system permease component